MDEALVERAVALARGGRAVLGIVGPPGAGKSTCAGALVERLAERGLRAALLPMDGFHIADVQLTRLGRLERKGAIDTFDGWGYLSTVLRALTETAHTVYAPGFERVLEQPIAGAVAIDPEVELVVTEGNYLLADVEPWSQLREVLAEIWYVEVPAKTRRNRLVERHVEFGKSRLRAEAWVSEVDEANARLIETGVERADLIIPGS